MAQSIPIGSSSWTNIVTSPYVPPGQIYFSATTNQVFMNAETNQSRQAKPAGEDQPMNQNLKTFLVEFTDGRESEHIEASAVEEKGARLLFTEHVNGATSVKKSVLGSLVASYEVVPAEEKPVSPKYTFRFTLEDGSSKTSDGDKVLITNGTDGQRGRYTVVTEISPGNNRTEIVVPEDLVKSVERVTESVSDQSDKV